MKGDIYIIVALIKALAVSMKTQLTPPAFEGLKYREKPPVPPLTL